MMGGGGAAVLAMPEDGNRPLTQPNMARGVAYRVLVALGVGSGLLAGPPAHAQGLNNLWMLGYNDPAGSFC